MALRRRGRIAAWVVGVLALLGVIAAFVMFGPPGLAERFAEPSFCASCHVMEPQYEAFQASAHRDLETCNDCHLPNDNFVRHWFWDAVVGLRDVIKWNLGIVPEDIRAKPRSQDWIQENCERCHDDVVHTMQTQDKRCWECHRETTHRLTEREASVERYGTRGGTSDGD